MKENCFTFQIFFDNFLQYSDFALRSRLDIHKRNMSASRLAIISVIQKLKFHEIIRNFQDTICSNKLTFQQMSFLRGKW